MSEFIQSLKQFVNDEAEAQLQKTRQTHMSHISERVDAGKAISNIEILAVTRDRIRLHCSENQSDFRIGDTLLLSKNRPASQEKYICALDQDLGHELVVVAGYQTKFNRLITGSGWTLDVAEVDVRNLLMDRLDNLLLKPDLLNHIRGILRGSQRPQFDLVRGAMAADAARTMTMNSSQSDAFIRALAADNYWPVGGPPGCGKTILEAQVAVALAKAGQRVLIVGATHQAANQTLRTIVKLTAFTRTVKIGSHYQTDGLAWPTGKVTSVEDFASLPFDPQQGGFIIGASCHALMTRRLSGEQFDTVLFEEAGQISLPLAIAVMSCGTKYLFFGDHRQLPPVVVASHQAKWTTRSVFETVVRYTPGSILEISYRMNQELIDFPSTRFYEKKLRSAEQVKTKRLDLKVTPTRFADILRPDRPAVFVEIPHNLRRLHSCEEAELIADLVDEAVKAGITPSEIGILATFRAQCRIIRNYLNKTSVPQTALKEIAVDTVDRFQGQERDLIIYSLATSDQKFAETHATSLFLPNRLNVAITRARYKRIVIASPCLFDVTPGDALHAEWIKTLVALRDESHVVSLACAV